MVDKKQETLVASEVEPASKQDHLLIIVCIGVALVVVLFVGIGLGSWGHTQRSMVRTVSIAGGPPGAKQVVSSSFIGGPGVGQAINSANSVRGTVTSANGSDFTVASYGSSTNVQTNSSTQYRYGDSVKVNDTVVVYGTTNNGTMTAALVSINP